MAGLLAERVRWQGQAEELVGLVLMMHLAELLRVLGRS
jgi:hypothetical protein